MFEVSARVRYTQRCVLYVRPGPAQKPTTCFLRPEYPRARRPSIAHHGEISVEQCLSRNSPWRPKMVDERGRMNGSPFLCCAAEPGFTTASFAASGARTNELAMDEPLAFCRSSAFISSPRVAESGGRGSERTLCAVKHAFDTARLRRRRASSPTIFPAKGDVYSRMGTVASSGKWKKGLQKEEGS